MMNIKFSDLTRLHADDRDHFINAFTEVIDNSTFIGGKHVTQFEDEFKAYINCKHCISCGSGTDALYIALKSLDLPTDSAVVVPSISYAATSISISNAQLKPIFVDVESSSALINIADLELKLKSNINIKCIIVVHLYGQVVSNINEIVDMAHRYNVALLEDCAQAHGVRYNNKHVGSFGNISIFSFYPGKNLGAFGDGGCICTNSSSVANNCYLIANLGAKVKYNHVVKGITSRLDNIHARVLSIKLKKLEDNNQMRRHIARLYDTLLHKYCPVHRDNGNDTYHVYYLLINPSIRSDLIHFLNTNGIETNIHYPISLNKLNCHIDDIGNQECKNAELFAKSCLSLPIFPGMTDAEIQYVATHILYFLDLHSKPE